MMQPKLTILPRTARRSPLAGRKKGKPIKFPGAAVFAREIGRSYSHVFQVLNGKRPNADIKEAYAKWLEVSR